MRDSWRRSTRRTPRIFDREVASGAIRSDVTAREILVAVALLCQPVPSELRAFNEQMVRLFVEGSRRE